MEKNSSHENENTKIIKSTNNGGRSSVFDQKDELNFCKGKIKEISSIFDESILSLIRRETLK